MQKNRVLSTSAGEEMYSFAETLFPICRSLSGEGVRKTLRLIQDKIPELNLFEVPTGEKYFDWTVPNEWNIKDAYILDAQGNKVVDFKLNNLHVMGYSTPIDTTLTLEELLPHLYSLPEQPNAIPYITSYYKPSWGFCLTENQRKTLKPGKYRVYIDSSLQAGSLTYGEILLPGEKKEEVFLSTDICHPSMANNEVSGPVLATEIAQWLKTLKKRKYSYRIAFVPETIGSIIYSARNEFTLKRQMIAGFVLSCVGDTRAYSFIESRLGNTFTDRLVLRVLKEMALDFTHYTFLERGSDERQYCSPLMDLPVVSILRSKHGAYPEYHTSLDDLSLISPEGLEGAFQVYTRCILEIENSQRYIRTEPCEPQLGKRGLHRDVSIKTTFNSTKQILDFLAFCDGQHDIKDISTKLNANLTELSSLAKELLNNQLIRKL